MPSSRGNVVRVGLAGAGLVLIAQPVLPAHAAASHYASPNGAGATCAQSDPCQLQTAIATAAAGDFVYLIANQGEYQLAGSVSTLPNTPIHIHSFGGRAQLTFSTGGLTVASGNVDGLTVHGSTTAAAFTLSGTSVASRMVAFSGSGQPACYVDTGTLVDSVCSTAGQSSPAAIQTDGSNELRNNTFVGGTTSALQAMGRNSQCSCTAATDLLVNDIVRSATGGKDIEVNSDGTATMTVKVRYSNFATSATTGSGAPSMTVLTQGAGNQTAPPVYVSQPPGDIHEDASSPTVDAGQTDAANGLYDVDGNARSMGTSTDIGADEFIAPPDTAIVRASVNTAKHKATLTFKSLGTATSFQCQLKARSSSVVPAYKTCTSPKTYRHLAAGKWRFRVRAIGAGGTDPTPAKKSFRA